jgi:hypothetical protein
VGVKQTEAQKYATEIIIADLKNTTIILENTMSVLLAEPSAKIERSTFESQKMQPEITLGSCQFIEKQTRCYCSRIQFDY